MHSTLHDKQGRGRGGHHRQWQDSGVCYPTSGDPAEKGRETAKKGCELNSLPGVFVGVYGYNA